MTSERLALALALVVVGGCVSTEPGVSVDVSFVRLDAPAAGVRRAEVGLAALSLVPCAVRGLAPAHATSPPALAATRVDALAAQDGPFGTLWPAAGCHRALRVVLGPDPEASALLHLEDPQGEPLHLESDEYLPLELALEPPLELTEDARHADLTLGVRISAWTEGLEEAGPLARAARFRANVLGSFSVEAR